MTQSSNSQFAVLSNGLIIKFSNIVGIQPNTSDKDEFYVHTVTSQYYKINENDYNYLKNILSEEPKMFSVFTSGLVVKNDYVIGIQPTDKDDEYYVHTTTPQYYKINKSDYCRFIGDNFTFNTSDPVETL
jgi:hypothetical protein